MSVEPYYAEDGIELWLGDCRRKAIGVELEERYCELLAQRLSQGVLDFSGLGATRNDR